MTTDPQTDYDGCNSECRKAGAHTLRWGGCEHAAEPESTVSMSVVYRDHDGQNSIGFDVYTVAQLAELIEPALRTIKIRLGPNARGMLERGEEVRLSAGEYVSLALAAAHAIVHRNADPAVSSAVAQSAPAKTALRDRIRRAVCEAEGFAWDSDMLEPDEYGDHADMILAVLPAADRPAGEAYRLAVSAALRLGTGATWEAIRDRAEDLTAEVAELTAAVDRAPVYSELADRQTQLAVADDLQRDRDMATARRRLVDELRSLAAEERAEREAQAHLDQLADELPAATDDTDLTETDVDRMMAAGVPVQIVTAPPATFAAAPAVSSVGQAAHTTRAADLLRRTEAYLSALHSSVARHDNLAANYGCAGCELRDQVNAELRRMAVEAQQQTETPADVQVWPLQRVLAEVRCGSQDWTWGEEWTDLDRRHVETGYLAKLEQQIRENGITMPVLIGSDGRLWDGHHRLRIAVRLGIDYVPVEVVQPAVVPGGAGEAPTDETREVEAHPPTHAWKVESPRRDKWASWGATHDERVWAAASYDDVIEVAPQRPFRLVRATTTYAVEAEHQPAAGPAGGAQQSKEARP